MRLPLNTLQSYEKILRYANFAVENAKEIMGEMKKYTAEPTLLCKYHPIPCIKEWDFFRFYLKISSQNLRIFKIIAIFAGESCEQTSEEQKKRRGFSFRSSE